MEQSQTSELQPPLTPQLSSLQTYTLKLQKISASISQLKKTSQSRTRSRRDKMNQFKRQQQRRQIELQEQNNSGSDQPSIIYRQQAVGGMVVQVPENHELHPITTDPYSPRNSIYYISQIIKNHQDMKSTAREHLDTSLQILKALEKSRMLTKEQISNKILNLQVKQGCKGLKTIVFDLDQTLIHCNQNLQLPHDIKISIKFPTGQLTEAGINIRPGAFQLLHSLKGKYEVMIFTASHSCYANQILNYLDPKGDLIHHRLYRQHCHIANEGYYVKDLRILGRKLKDILLVDNAAYSYAYQLDNGVPILPYFKGKNDFQLRMLGEYLLSLSEQTELRSHNHRTFKLNRYLQFTGRVEQLVQELYL